jgi:hypothetical protein
MNAGGGLTRADRADPPSPARWSASAPVPPPAVPPEDVHRRGGAVTALAVLWVVACLGLYASQLVGIAGG